MEEDGKAMLYLVFEYLDQDLKNYMDMTGRGPSNPLPKPVVQDFMYQLCLGCAHLHRHGVMHRDLKPQNLLVDKAKNVIKVADLGLGRAFSVPVKSYTHEIVTLWYRAPELLLGLRRYGPAVDMWATGCILAEFLRNQPIFPGKTETDTVARIFAELGAPHDGIWPGWSSLPLATTFAVPHQPYNHLSITFAAFGADAVDLLTQLLTYDPAKRVDAASARAHRFLAPDSDPPPRPMRDMPTFSSPHESAGRVGLGGTETTGDWNREDERRGGDEDKSKRAKR